MSLAQLLAVSPSLVPEVKAGSAFGEVPTLQDSCNVRTFGPVSLLMEKLFVLVLPCGSMHKPAPNSVEICC